jgi:hypothetical protein
MQPKIDKTEFGSITLAGVRVEHDVIIRLGGKVERRKKSLSKEIYGTSHIISLPEAEYIYEKGADKILIGAGQDGMVKLSDEAANFFHSHKCAVEVFPTPEAIRRWNQSDGKMIGLFHITC